jgi:acyl carrier protein
MSTARTLLADAIGIPVHDLPQEPRLGEFERWDSLAHTRIMLALEERLKRPLDPDDVVAIASLADIEALLARHG